MDKKEFRVSIKQWSGKVMASVFWDAHGILFIDYLEKGKTINSDYYMALLDWLNAEIKKKRPYMQKRKVLFHQANVPCQKQWMNVLRLKETMLMNEVEFLEKTVFFLIRPETYWVMC